MPRPLPGRGLLLHGQRRHNPRPSQVHEEDQVIRTWNAVIQFSARHLFCPAHAHSALASTATAPQLIRTRARAGVEVGTEPSPPIRTSIHRHRRKYSTAATAVATDMPFYTSSGSLTESDRRQQGVRFRQDSPQAPLSAPTSLSTLTPQSASSRSIPTRSTSIPTSTSLASLAKASVTSHFTADCTEGTSRASCASSKEEASKQQQHQMTASWRFPVPASSPQQCLYGTQDPVQLWPSTSEALSKVYRGLNQIRSSVQSSPSSSSTSLSASGLESVLSHYNYLSQLQASYDTVLIPRRDTRTLFLLQSKERKTRDNLNQLLRIAMDLIWLNEKERQRKRRRSFAGSSLLSDKDRPSTIHIHNPADDYHGLRVSEYTILMDWVGSVSRSARVSRASQEPSFASNDRLLAVDLRSSLHQHSSGRREPVDRAWAIWQDFLLTGMKPDVVLYTSLMDMLLKAKEFDRADQIWQHMQQKSNSGKSSYGMSHPISSSSAATVGKLLDPLAKSLNLGAKDDGPSAFSTASANRKPYLVHILDKKNRSHHYLDHSQDWDKDGSGVTPNLQTFSVLIQNHVLNKDLKAIARTYKEMQRQATNTANPSSGQQRRPANTVLLNQILKVLIDLGEASAAKEIYADMKMSSSSSLSGSLASERGPGEYTTETGAISTATSISASSWRSSQSRCPTAFTSMSPPPHHQNFQRRAAWERGNRERRLAAAFELSCPTSLWMRPDDTTHRLMLRLARQEGDVELEDQILEELLPSS